MALLAAPQTRPNAHLPLRTPHRPRGPVAILPSRFNSNPSPQFHGRVDALTFCAYTALRLRSESRGHRDRAAALESAAARALSPASAPQEAGEGAHRRILLSDVVITRPRRVFRRRRWNSLDVATVGVVLAMHLMSLFSPFCFSWRALWVAVGLYLMTGLFGITLSFHRNLSHRSFKLPKWLEYTFAYCGVLALQVPFIPSSSKLTIIIRFASILHFYLHFQNVNGVFCSCNSQIKVYFILGQVLTMFNLFWVFVVYFLVYWAGEPNRLGEHAQVPPSVLWFRERSTQPLGRFLVQSY